MENDNEVLAELVRARKTKQTAALIAFFIMAIVLLPFVFVLAILLS